MAKIVWGQADLNDTDLIKADLIRTNLKGAKLVGANLQHTNLRRANLWNADLRETILWEANFRTAVLKNATIENASLWNSVFTDVDLSDVSGLETVKHIGPSSIGIDTLYKSKGNIPEAFLCGCGVPDQMIEYARSLTTSPIEYYSCFISYNHEDEEFAKRIYNDLRANNVLCWLACEDMKIGTKIRPTIDEKIRSFDKLLLILSERSIASDWVEHEVEHALDLEKERKKTVLFPVRVDDTVMASKTGWAGNIRRQRHIGDFTQWKHQDAYKKSFDRLLHDLKTQ